SLPGYLALFVSLVLTLSADPLTRSIEVDFGRDVASRNLKGLATRSDGRVLPGPVFTDLTGPKVGDILWTLRATGADKSGFPHFLVGTGPDGRVKEVIFNTKDRSYTVREVAKVAEAQITAVLPLPNGDLLAGTSPTGVLYLIHDGKPVARVPLPADSVFDFLALPDGSILAATGNPGKIYRIDPAALAKAGLTEGKVTDDKLPAGKGVTLFGEVRDRNVRRLLRLADGRVIAGSSPKGNVYAFSPTADAPAKAVEPMILQENRDAEVVDLLPDNEGGFYAGLVFSPGEGSRLVKVKSPLEDKDDKDVRPAAFPGRSTVVHFPTGGYPETVVSKTGLALYRLASHSNWLLLAAGEAGDTLGYDPVARRSLVFAGSASSQLNDIAPLGDGRFLLLRNNAPGLALLDFAPSPARELETRRLDLGSAGELGLVRLPRVHGLDLSSLRVEARTNFGSDELEGWSSWTELKPADGAFSAAGLRGRYLRLRLTVPAAATDFQIDKAVVYYLPQNHRPTLNDFRIFPANLGINPVPEPPAPAVSTLAQMLSPAVAAGKDEPGEKHKNAFLNSQIIPQNGTQLVYWAVSDPDGDNLACTFSIRPENSDTWTDLAVDTRDSYVQFDTGALPEGLYLTRLTVKEQAPRPEKDRLSFTFETDYLTIDRTPPVITLATAEHRDGKLILTVEGRDALSLLSGAEFNLNNGTHEETEHPADGVLDSRFERFVVEIPEARAAGATSVEILLYDQPGNSSSKRLPLK
ncbi:MAG: hypothetical protein ACHQ5A_12590, partial [Opitutales bacterium]